MKFPKLACFILLFSLSLSASNRPWTSAERLRVLGVSILAISGVSIAATSYGVGYGCPENSDGCNGLYWKIVPGFLVSASGGLLALVWSICPGHDATTGTTYTINRDQMSDDL